MNAIWKDKLLRLYLVLFVLSAFSTSVIGAFGGISEIKDVKITGWIIIIFSIVSNCASTILAFINKNASKLEQGQLPIYSQEIETETKTTTTTESKETNENKT